MRLVNTFTLLLLISMLEQRPRFPKEFRTFVPSAELANLKNRRQKPNGGVKSNKYRYQYSSLREQNKAHI